MVPAILVIALGFIALSLFRIGGARRVELLAKWPALVLGVIAAFSVFRGGYWSGLALMSAAVLLWNAAPQRRAAPHIDLGENEARAALGVSAQATPDEIRAAYRARMANAHPDRGGTHDEAARLTAARDRLLKGK